MTYADRVAERAATVRPVRIVVTVLTGALWLAGVLIGIVWLLLKYAGAALLEGMADARRAVSAVQARTVVEGPGDDTATAGDELVEAA